MSQRRQLSHTGRLKGLYVRKSNSQYVSFVERSNMNSIQKRYDVTIRSNLQIQVTKNNGFNF